MDIDHIRELVRLDRMKFSNEARKRMSDREVELEQIEEAIFNGRIVREEPRKKPYPKCTIRGYTKRGIAGLLLPDLHLLNVACGVGEEVHVITIYWE